VRVGAAACMAGLARGGGKRDQPIEDDREMAPVAGGVVGRRLFSRTKLGKGKHMHVPRPTCCVCARHRTTAAEGGRCIAPLLGECHV
jgi:hypothetical protein